MADVILTRGGLKSQAPGTSKFEQTVKRAGGGGTTTSGGSSRSDRQREKEREAEAERQRLLELQKQQELARQQAEAERKQKQQEEFNRKREEAKRQYSIQAYQQRTLSKKTQETISSNRDFDPVRTAKQNLQSGEASKILSRVSPSSVKAQARDKNKVPPVIRNRIGYSRDTRPSVNPEKVLGAVFPSDTKEATQLVALGGLTAGSPAIIRSGVGGVIGVTGGRVAINKELTPEERTAGAIVGVAGISGTVAEVKPFVRGGIARLKGAKTPETVPRPKLENPSEEAINKRIFDQQKEVIKTGGTEISLIPEGKGARGVPIPTQKAQLGKPVSLASSQRGLIKNDRSFDVLAIPGQPEGVFFTPTPKSIGPSTRVSRLGLVEPFKDATGSQLGFGEVSKPQILLGEQTKLKNIGKQSSELETLLFKIGETIPVIKRPPVVIKGQQVSVFELTNKPLGSKGVVALPSPSGRTPSSVPVSSALSPKITGVIRNPSPKISSSTKPPRIIRPSLSIDPTSSPSLTIVSGSPKAKTSGKSTPTSKGSGPISTISPPITKPSSPSSPLSKPINYYYRGKSTISPPIKNPRTPRLSTISPKYPKQKFKQPKGLGSVTVLGRRQGKFKVIGVTDNLNKAVNIGKGFATKTLGATFKVLGGRGSIRTPTGFYKGKGTRVFIEKPKFRLSTSTEISEIQGSKRRKRKK